ncbi:MAG: glycosyltransferase family 39 protein [Candidatus Omnitrophica bacterium]|nr:glycosyltransferase family 39 protein [Candidatus Omnitrophota bacterium]
MTLGGLNDLLVKIIFPLYFVGILILLYFAIRRFAGSTYALVFTFLLATIPQFTAYACNAYVDLPLAYYCFISAILLFEWFRDRSKYRFIVLSAVMAALAGWTKNEGLMYCAAYLLTIIIFLAFNIKKNSVRDYIYVFFSFAIIAAISAPWLFLKKQTGLANVDMGAMDLSPAYLAGNLYKLKPIFYEFQKEMFGPKKWNIFWVVSSVILILRFKSAFSGIRRYVTILLCLMISGYILAYMVSPIDVRYFLAKTWSRFLLHFLPISVYWLALILKEDVEI